MNRLAAIVTLFAVAAAPLAARAHEEDPGECTTTVHCTGAAARFAVPQPVQPLPPPPPAPPPAYYPPPPPVYPQNPVMLDLRRLEEGGWRLVQGSDGTLWRERKVSSSSPGVWGTGLALFTLSWLGTGISSVIHSDLGPLGFLPVFGAWANAAVSGGNSNCSYDYYGYSSCSDHRGATAGWAIGGIAQVAGMTMFFVGLASGPKKIERQPVMITPGMVGSGSAASTPSAASSMLSGCC